MENLVYLKNNEAVCSSLDVAEKFHKRHDTVLRSIEGLRKNVETHGMFRKGFYVNTQNKKQPMYYMNRDGFSLLVMNKNSAPPANTTMISAGRAKMGIRRCAQSIRMMSMCVRNEKGRSNDRPEPRD